MIRSNTCVKQFYTIIVEQLILEKILYIKKLKIHLDFNIYTHENISLLSWYEFFFPRKKEFCFLCQINISYQLSKEIFQCV